MVGVRVRRAAVPPRTRRPLVSVWAPTPAELAGFLWERGDGDLQGTKGGQEAGSCSGDEAPGRAGPQVGVDAA